MKYTSPRSVAPYLACSLALALTRLAFGQGVEAPQPPSKPPTAPVREVTDDYFGTKVTDPYRYMEDLKDPEVIAWMKAQDAYTLAARVRLSF